MLFVSEAEEIQSPQVTADKNTAKNQDPVTKIRSFSSDLLTANFPMSHSGLSPFFLESIF